jgi:hypothetical protein
VAFAVAVLQGRPTGGDALNDAPVVIEAKRQRFDTVHQVFVYEDGVVATYGPTTLRADRLTIDQLNQTFEAVGHISLVDPDGLLTAETLRGAWKPSGSSGEATMLHGEIAGARFDAKRAVITPEKWSLYDVSGTTCRQRTPFYTVSTRQVDFYPGRYGRVTRPRLTLLGLRLPSVPTQRFNLDRRTEGIQFPSIAYRKDEGLGVSWRAGLLVDHQSVVSAAFGAFKTSYPTFDLLYARSFIPEKDASGLVAPKSDLSERFGDGFFESIEVEEAGTEWRTLKQRRETVAVGSSFNQGAVGRDVASRVRYNKPLELTYERNRAFPGFAVASTSRVQSIGSQVDPYRVRFVSQYAVGLEPSVIARNMTSLVRLDSATFLGKNGFGWGRLTLGATYRPWAPLALSAAGIGAFEYGNSELPIDELATKSGYVLRADANLGSTRIRLMHKWDQDLGWFDREYSVYQVVGCMEAYVMYRQFTHDYRFGVKFRIDQFVNLLQRKEFQRTAPAETGSRIRSSQR